MGSCFSHDGLSNRKSISIIGTIFWKIELYYVDYELIYLTLWTYVFSMMACLMGIIIRFWDKYFKFGITLFWLWAYIFYIMDWCFSRDGLSNGNNAPEGRYPFMNLIWCNQMGGHGRFSYWQYSTTFRTHFYVETICFGHLSCTSQLRP